MTEYLSNKLRSCAEVLLMAIGLLALGQWAAQQTYKAQGQALEIDPSTAIVGEVGSAILERVKQEALETNYSTYCEDAYVRMASSN